MFSQKEKQFLASEIEKLILGLKHPEMPTECPLFVLTVKGTQGWSFAEIRPNWIFEHHNIKPGVNPWNEIAREVLPKQEEK